MDRPIRLRVRLAALASVCVTVLAAAPARGGGSHLPVPASDSTDVVQTVARFHAALASGDSLAALRLLAPDVRIIESGGVEDRERYRHHHLPADIAFARAVPNSHAIANVVVAGDVAWISSTSESKGMLNGRAVNSVGAELMVLSRDPHAAHASADQAPRWVIRAIHWSSRRGKA